MSQVNSFGSKDTLTVGSTDYEIFRVDRVPGFEKLPFSLKVLLENLLRTEDGANVTRSQIEALGAWVEHDFPPEMIASFNSHSCDGYKEWHAGASCQL